MKLLIKLKDLRRYLHVLPVTEQDIDKAIERNWHDFEDAVQYTVAETNAVDFILSRNARDYEEDRIPCLSPAAFLDKLAKGDITL
ncbi:MAG: hypothetical protein IKP40_12460 [Clostridia bacterium]|nr:hypothetical protein [Clostridia bacterium]